MRPKNELFIDSSQKENFSNQVVKSFLPIIIFSLFIHLITAYFSTGFDHTDEHNQVLEFANIKWGSNLHASDDWAYGNKIRSWLQPAIYYSIRKITTFIGLDLNPFTLATIFRIFSSLFSFVSMLYFVLSFSIFFKKDIYKKLFIYLSQFLWFIPYIMSRTSSENFGFAFMAIALAQSINFPSKKYLTGMIMGASFLCRFQMGFSILFYGLWILIYNKSNFKIFIPWIFGVIVSILLGVMIDYWGYGSLTLSAWNYYELNIIQHVADWFGITPWWQYFKLMFIKGIPPYSIIMIMLVFYYWFKNYKNMLTWISLPFFFIHCCVGHKEFRFLFPLFLLSPFMISKACEQLDIYWKNTIYSKLFIKIGIIINSILLTLLMFKPAHIPIGLYKYIYNNIDLKNDKIHVLTDSNKEHITFPYYFYMKEDPILISHDSIDEISDTKGIILTRRNNHAIKMLERKDCNKLYSTYPLWIFNLKLEKILAKSNFIILWKCQ